jgi:cyanate permease
MPQVGAWLIAERGWRGAYAVWALLPVVLVLVVIFIMRDSPEDKGLKALGAETSGDPEPGQGSQLPGMTFSEAIRTRTFWAVTTMSMLTFYAILGVVAHIFLHMREQGFEQAVAARGIAWLFLMALVGKFVFGFLADQFNHKWVFFGNLGIMLVGSILLATMKPDVFWPFAILFGVGWGGLYTMLQLLTVEAFGLRAAGKIIGTRTILDALGGGLGPWLTGVLYDSTGSYQVPFLVIVVCVILSMLIATQVKTEVKAKAASPAGA